tara:strand:+ start:8566 stop:8742 length:177 start_codon:yes stop_codon:yes gene_type:complete
MNKLTKEQVKALVRDAFYAGFMTSGQGFNGEFVHDGLIEENDIGEYFHKYAKEKELKG